MIQAVRAALARKPNAPLTIERVDLREPREHEVLVEIKATGLCHSDLHALHGKGGAEFPVILGHEGAGIIVECGPNVTNVRPGDHVIVFGMPDCGVCPNCRSERTNLCVDFISGADHRHSAFSLNGQRISAWSGAGTFANFSVVRDSHVTAVRKDAPFEKICYIGCGVATGVGAALFAAKVKAGSTVLVVGLGGVGLNVVQGARLAGAKRIIGLDVNQNRDAISRRIGATDFINPGILNRGIVEHILELTQGGADYVFECVGSAKLIRLAFDCTRIGWGVCTVVGAAVENEDIRIPPLSLLSGRRLIGTILGGTRGQRDLAPMVDWYMDGKLNLDDLVSHVLPLERINEGYELLQTGQSLRTIVKF